MKLSEITFWNYLNFTHLFHSLYFHNLWFWFYFFYNYVELISSNFIEFINCISSVINNVSWLLNIRKITYFKHNNPTLQEQFVYQVTLTFCHRSHFLDLKSNLFPYTFPYLSISPNTMFKLPIIVTMLS